MQVVSIINYKGGVGKTTLAANLAAEMAYRDYRVLAIDLDPQTNLTFSFIKVDEWANDLQGTHTIKNYFDSIIDPEGDSIELSNLIVSINSNFDLICSHLGLIDVDIELAAGLSSATERQHRKNYVRTYSLLKSELDKLEEEYDIVLIDCPPNFNIVTKNAIIASDYYVIPSKMDYLSTLGINQLNNHVNNLVSTYNRYIGSERMEIEPELLGIIPTMVSIRNNAPIRAHQQYIDALKRSNFDMFDNIMRENKTIFADAPEYGTPVVMKSYSGATYKDIVTELEDLTSEFIDKVGI